MNHPLNRLALALAGAALLTVAGCGGGSGNGTGSGDGGAPETTKVSARVIDGAIENALVCLDTNRNGSCDAGEPSGRTDAAGNATLEVPAADAGKYPVVAMVGTDATDADHGPVATPFTLKAPAGQEIISPLTTLVQSYLELTGGSAAAAADAVQRQLGLDASPMADFTLDASDAGKQAGLLARLVVVTTQAQREATAGAKGADDQPLTTGEIDGAINARLVELLQRMALAILDDPTLSDPAVSLADKQARIAAAADQIAQAAGLTKDNVGAVVAAQNPGGPAEQTGVAGASLRWFTFTNLQNYMLRAFEFTAAQSTPDAGGKTHFTEVREQQVNGVLSEWGMGANNWVRPQIYWTGSAWFDCPTTFVHDNSAPNVAGETQSLYCNAVSTRVKSSSNRDVSGRKLIDVVREIRAYPATDSSHGAYANWGPDPDKPAIQSALGNAVFPAGSVLSVRAVTDYVGGARFYLRTSEARIPREEDPLNPNTATWRSATLDQFVQWNQGDYAPGVENNVHGNNAHVLLNREYTRLDGNAAYKRYMAGFGAGTGKARFYECEGDMASRSETPPRNSTLFIDGKSTCRRILETSYTVTAQGDGKVLRFAALPTQLNESAGERVLVERAGKSYVGYTPREQASTQLRLNQAAAEALLAALGLD